MAMAMQSHVRPERSVFSFATVVGESSKSGAAVVRQIELEAACQHVPAGLW